MEEDERIFWFLKNIICHRINQYRNKRNFMNNKKIPNEIEIQSLNISKNKGFGAPVILGIIASIFILVIILHYIFDARNKSIPGIQNSSMPQATGLEKKLDVQTSNTKTPPVSKPIQKTTPPPTQIVPETSNAERNQKLMLQLINPLLNKYTLLTKSIESQLPLWEDTNQLYTSTIANLQKLQSVFWRNDVQGVIDQLLYEKDLLSKYVDLAKGRQGYSGNIIETLNSLLKTHGGESIDTGFIKQINKRISEIDSWILEYDMNNPDSVTATLKMRYSKIDTIVKALFQRLQNSQ